MAPPLVPITLQAAVMSVVSSLLAQLLTAYRSHTSLSFDWQTVYKFVVFTVLTTPPNVLWQDFLERSLPGSRKEKRGEKGSAAAPKESLHIPNTIAKTLLDQSAGACVNTFLFCAFMASWDVLMGDGGDGQGADPSLGLSVGLLAAAVAGRARADFVRLLTAGWRFWPLVSLGNFALVPDVATRNLVGGLAGIAWGVYVNLFAAGSAVKGE